MWEACRDRKLAFLWPCIIVNKIALLAKMPTHAQTGCCVLEVLLGLSPVTSLSLGLNANARGDVRKHREGHGVLEEGVFQWQHFFPSRRLWLLSLRDSWNLIAEFSTLTGHRGHCLLTQPGQKPCHLQKGVHTFCYFHMSISNFLNKL